MSSAAIDSTYWAAASRRALAPSLGADPQRLAASGRCGAALFVHARHLARQGDAESDECRRGANQPAGPRRWPRNRSLAILLPYPVEDVWAVVSDYDKYGDLLPYLNDITAEKIGDDEYRMKGQAKSVIRGYWPFEITIHQAKKTDGGRISWDESSTNGEVRLNRGSWLLTKHGDNETLLVLSLEAEVQSTPTFLLRNFFLYRLKHVVLAVESAVQRRQGS